MTFIFCNEQETKNHNTFGKISKMFFYNPAWLKDRGVAGQKQINKY